MFRIYGDVDVTGRMTDDLPRRRRDNPALARTGYECSAAIIRNVSGEIPPEPMLKKVYISGERKEIREEILDRRMERNHAVDPGVRFFTRPEEVLPDIVNREDLTVPHSGVKQNKSRVSPTAPGQRPDPENLVRSKRISEVALPEVDNPAETVRESSKFFSWHD